MAFEPWVRRWFALPPTLVLVLALVAAANLTKLSTVQFGPDRPVDFRPGYVGQYALRHGFDPYQDSNLRASWRRIVADEGLASHSTPGLPDQTFIYPPWAAAWFGIMLGALPYSWAWPLWYGVVLLSRLAARYITRRALAVFWAWAAEPWAYLGSYRQLNDYVQHDVVRPDQPGYPLGRGMILQFGLRNLLEFPLPGGHRWAGLLGLMLGGLALGRL